TKIFPLLVQPVYQTENSNVTMEWTFTPILTITDLNIYFELWLPELQTSKSVYYLKDGVELPKAQHEQFTGRVQLDKDELRKGNIRLLHLSSLRTNDSGVYQCEVFTLHDGDACDYGRVSECSLNVTGK
uniref:Uncharacterized protein n=1 Tax=Myripristis murdjan TaxID=586833 RepID=A0A667ZDS3_9TELE